MGPLPVPRGVSCLQRRILPVAIATASAGATHAQSVERIGSIEVTGHYENAIGTSDAASQGTITRQLIEDRPLLRPAQVLEYVPGVIVTQHSGAGKANQYFLRGFNLDHGTDFATWLAGMPVNLPTHAPWTGVHGPQLHDPRAGRAHRLLQGALLRRDRRLLVRGWRVDPLRRPRCRRASPRRRSARSTTNGGCSPGRRRSAPARCSMVSS